MAWSQSGGFSLLAVAMTPDGETVVTGDHGGIVHVWSVAKGIEIGTLSGHEGSIGAVDIDLERSRFASAAFDGIRLWRLPAGLAERHIPATRGATTWLQFAPDGKSLASGGPGRNEPVRIWDVRTGLELAWIAVGPTGPSCGAYSPDGSRLVTGYVREIDGADISVWDIANRRELARFSAHHGDVKRIVYTADGTRIVSADSMGELAVWDSKSVGSCRRRISGHGGEITALAVSRNGHLLLSASRGDKVVRCWELATGAELARFLDHESPVTGLAFSADGRRAISAGLDATAFLWDTKPGALPGSKVPRRFTDDEGAALWKVIVSRDAIAAQRATWDLIASPEVAVRVVESNLRPTTHSQRQQIDQAIQYLDHSRGEMRREAMQKLTQFGNAAELALRQERARRPSLLVRQRLDAVLNSIQGQPAAPESLAAARGIRILENIGNSDARRVLSGLADGAKDDECAIAAAAALQRLDRQPSPTSRATRIEGRMATRPDRSAATRGAAVPTIAPATGQPPSSSPLTGDSAADATAVAAEIDRPVEAGWEGAGVVPAPIAGDEEFLRRVTLDLAGRIPQAYEVRDFTDGSAVDKRRRLVERLFDSDEFVEHRINVWRDMFLGPPVK